MDNEFGTLRKKAFGGFNPKDVVSIIEKSRNELFEYKNEAQKNIEELKSKIEKIEKEKEALEKVNEDLGKANSELQKENAELKKTNEELSFEKNNLEEVIENKSKALPVSDNSLIYINEATDELKKVADDLCTSLRDFMEKISENSISVTVENREVQEEEEFDAQKFMAELEAEIYEKLGVETQEKAEVALTDNIAEIDEEKEDKVSSILSRDFSFMGKSPDKAKNAEPEIFGFLKGASFIK